MKHTTPADTPVQRQSYDAWIEAFRPLPNVVFDQAPYDGTMYETYGAEYDHLIAVADVAPATIWTLVDGEEDLHILSGLHRVNRVGYFITEVAVDSGVEIEVDFDSV